MPVVPPASRKRFMKARMAALRDWRRPLRCDLCDLGEREALHLFIRVEPLQCSRARVIPRADAADRPEESALAFFQPVRLTAATGRTADLKTGGPRYLVPA